MTQGTNYPAARFALNFLSFLMLVPMAWIAYEFPFGTTDGVPTRERILIAVGAFTVGLFVLIVQYWLVAAIFDIADALRSGSNPFTSQGK